MKKDRKNITRLKIIGIVGTVLLSVLLGGCSSCDRQWKTMQSDIDGGLNRIVTLYDYNGEVVREWSGKFDISSNDQEIFFDDQDGKRVIIQGGIVVSEES